MRKLVQDLEKGRMESMEVPDPRPGPQEILVRNHYSVISPGTEGKTVSDARKGYWAKAKARRQEVEKVIRTAREKGIRETYRIVKDRLQAPSSLGYSCCGEVLETGSEVEGIRVGDRVACAGGQAGHAELVAVPRMLCAKVPENVSSEEAAFTTIGAIALQGIRRAELDLGSNALVIGAGLIGLTTAELLKAGGMRPILVDTDAERIAFAQSIGLHESFERGREDLEERIASLTGERGVDATLITAATSSTDPVELAGRLCRERAKVVMVGDSATGFSRRNFYQKELELRMSKSYGPGRKDPTYEERGTDYPIGHVRWTENRNMEAVLDLLGTEKLRFSPLITQRYPFARAREAYDGILQSDSLHIGVLLEYEGMKRPLERVHRSEAAPKTSDAPRIALIGGGSFARNSLLPSLPKGVELTHVSTRDPAVARYLGEKYGAERWSSDPEEALADEGSDALMIATRHDSHGWLVEKGLERGKQVFVEKPLCLERTELERIEEAYRKSSGSLMVGFNRRFAPLIRKLLSELNPEAPRAIRIHVNAGKLPSDHWVHDPHLGGGRILGEAPHFLDLASALAGSPIEAVSGEALPNSKTPPDTLVSELRFRNGSIASIFYSSEGGNDRAKERIELHQHGRSFYLTDFKELRSIGNSERKERGKADKGHEEELAQWASHLKGEAEAPIPFEELVNTTKASFAMKEAIERGEKLLVEGRGPERDASRS